MHPITKLVVYLTITGGLVVWLVSAATFLITPEPGSTQQAKAAPVVPKRIADSIERKKAPAPQPEPVVLPAPVKPIMQEANVALTPAPPPKIKIRELNPPPKKIRQPRLAQTPSQAPSVTPRTVVTTARTDMPY
jgi:hypothetical protein